MYKTSFQCSDVTNNVLMQIHYNKLQLINWDHESLYHVNLRSQYYGLLMQWYTCSGFLASWVRGVSS